MNIFDRIKGAATAFFGVKTKDALGDVIKELQGSTTVSVKQANKGWSHIAVRKIAEVAATPDWGLYRYRRDDEVEEVEGHIVNDFLTKPNSRLNFKKFVYKMVGQALFTGAVPIRIKSKARGQLGIYILDSSRLTVKYDAEGLEVLKYEYKNPQTGMLQAVAKEEIAFYEIPDFFTNGNSGIVEHITDWILAEREQNSLGRKIMENGAFIGGVLETEATSQEQITKTRQLFEDRYTGADNAGRTIITPKGTKYTDRQLNPQALQFTEQDTRHEEKILKAFSVPKALLGDVDASGRANVDGAFYGFARFVILPILRDLQDFFNEELLPKITSDEGVFVNFENPVPEDKTFLLEERKASLGGKGWKTQNEVRAEDGLEPLEGGDNLPASASPAFTLNSIRVPKSVKNRVKMAETRREEIRKKVSDTKSEFEKAADVIDEVFREALHKDFIGRVSERQRELQSVFLDHAEKLQARVVEQLPEGTKGQKASVDYFDVKEEAESLRISSAETLQRIAIDEGLSAYGLVENPAGKYDPNSKELQRAIKNLFMLRGESYARTTLKKLNETVQEGIAAGEGKSKLTKRVAEVFDLTKKYRAAAMAQDVAFSTANSAIRSAYEQSKVVESIKWHVADSEACPFCLAMNGKAISTKEVFFKKGDTLQAGSETLSLDFENIAHPPVHSGCRCFLLPERITF